MAHNFKRMTISISAILKKEMDAINGVNWSAVAARAFEAELVEVRARKETATMDDVIERLKAADKEDASEAFANGKEAGDTWARQQGRPKQLRRLAEFPGDPTYTISDMLGVFCNGMNSGIACGLFDWMKPHGDQSETRDFWDGILGDGGMELIEDEDFALGFFAGALEVWGKVEDKL